MMQKKYYNCIQESNKLVEMIPLLEPLIDSIGPNMAEYRYEFKKTKDNFPEGWKLAEETIQDMNIKIGNNSNFGVNIIEKNIQINNKK